MDVLRRWSRYEPVRLWLYGLLGPLVGLLVARGVVGADDAVLWLALATAALSVPAVEGARSQVTPYRPALTDGVPLPRPPQQPGGPP